MSGVGRNGNGETKVKISFGGGLKKSAPVLGSTGQQQRKTAIFDDDDDERQDLSSTTALPSAPSSSSSSRPKLGPGVAPSSRAAQQRQDEALALDASVFDYDGVYDSMKEGERGAERERERERERRDPKYVAASLAASEQRKLDRQRAEARKIQREREQEGDTFADTESFVTDAYKQQMEAMQADEERERRQEEERKRRKAANRTDGTATFLKDYMTQQDRQHRAAVEAASASGKSTVTKPDDDDQPQQPSSESMTAMRVRQARMRGLDVRVNDDNEVVDERSLLTAGLNKFPSKRKAISDPRADDVRSSARASDFPQSVESRSRNEQRNAQRQRQSDMMQEQLLALEREREQAQKANVEQQRAALMTGRRNDDDKIAQARQRALERRQQRDNQ